MNGFHGHKGHSHAHGPARFRLAFAIGIALNVALIALQVTYGIIANSVALLADAGHNLGDVVGLLLAWGATAASRMPPSSRYTYGLGSTSILAALANAIILLVAVGAIALEAIRRLGSAEPIQAVAVMIVAAAGIAINGVTALLFMAGKDDLNIRGAFLHMSADALISLGVLVSAAAIYFTGRLWLDPLTSLIISTLIIWATWGLLRDSVNLALQAVPSGIDPDKVRVELELLSGVARIHDLHIWAMSTTETALTCHLVMPAGHPGDRFIADAAKMLNERFGISHTTLQIECGDFAACKLAPSHVI